MFSSSISKQYVCYKTILLRNQIQKGHLLLQAAKENTATKHFLLQTTVQDWNYNRWLSNTSIFSDSSKRISVCFWNRSVGNTTIRFICMFENVNTYMYRMSIWWKLAPKHIQKQYKYDGNQESLLLLLH